MSASATAQKSPATPPLNNLAGPSLTRQSWVILLLLAALVGLSVLRLFIGESFGWPSGDNAALVLRLRYTRLALGLLVGLGLAASGVGLQALLRNPLAEPFILGLSSGAAVGVIAQMLLAYFAHRSFGPNHIGAVLGALGSMGLVFIGGRRRGVIDPLGLLLVGVVLSTINGAIIMVLNYLLGPAGLREDLARWMMGYLNEGLKHQDLAVVAALTLGGILVMFWRGKAMDVATFSDAEAQSLGVNVGQLRLALFVIASVLAAGAVVLAGPIAFVGLICPHLARLLVGPAHRPLVLAAALLGAMLIIVSDIFSVSLDWVTHWGRMPIGVFTALIGGPVFLWMLRPYLGRGAE